MCVASSSGHDRLRLVLGLTDTFERFEGRIFSAEEVQNGKPAPDLFLLAAERSGADPARCVVVEDSEAGVQAGVAAGMRVLGYAGGLTSRERLSGAGAEVFDRMDELPALILDD
jgi:HAD superfamily hydrolase (TIGR01509 family)